MASELTATARRSSSRGEAFEGKMSRVLVTLPEYFRMLNNNAKDFAPKTPEDPLHPLFVEALHNRGRIEYWLDFLIPSNFMQKIQFYKDHKQEVTQIERKIRSIRKYA